MNVVPDGPGALAGAAAGDRSAGEARPGKVRFAGAEVRARLEGGGLAALRRPDEAGWQKVKSNAVRTVHRGSLDGQVLYVKHYRPRALWRRAARRLGLSSARREMRFMRYLAERGVTTAPVLAASWGGGEEWLATAAVEPSQPADAWHVLRLREGAAGQ